MKLFVRLCGPNYTAVFAAPDMYAPFRAPTKTDMLMVFAPGAYVLQSTQRKSDRMCKHVNAHSQSTSMMHTKASYKCTVSLTE